MSRWRTVRKIDAHVHVVLHQRQESDLSFNPPEAMLRAMDDHNVERAIVVPINFPDYFPLRAAYDVDWLGANNELQAKISRDSNGRLVSFADCRIDGPYEDGHAVSEAMGRAVDVLGLDGLKIHAYNLDVEATDRRLEPWIDAAARFAVPIVFHANPSGGATAFHGCSPSKIYEAMHGRSHPFVIAHMGGVAFLEALAGGGYVDVSGTLLWLAELYGAAFCTRLVRRIGVDRILFATDFPIYPYEAYYRVLDAMELTDDEVERIAFANAERMLRGRPPVDREAESTESAPIG